MVKPSIHRTLVGGTFTRTQYVEGSDHVHIHFLDIGKTEICCHGCHSSILYLHHKKSQSSIQGLLKKYAHKHEKCSIGGAGFEEWCPDIRLSLQVIDLSKPSSDIIDTHRED